MGIALTIRGSVLGNIFDSFNRSDIPLAGTVTTMGGRVWTKLTGGDTVFATRGQKAKCISGTTTDIYALDVSSGNYDLSFIVPELRAGEAHHSFVFRIVDDANHFALLFRQSGQNPRYCIAKRLAGAYTFPLITPIIPKAGDKVALSVTNDRADLSVNGVHLGSASIPGWEKQHQVGFRIAGTDNDTAFDDLSVLVKR